MFEFFVGIIEKHSFTYFVGQILCSDLVFN